MQSADEAACEAWCEKYGNHPDVIEWLKAHPPPKYWIGTRESWAYTEMITTLR